jgi:DNA-binding CsgD family transcriptional regulator
MHHTNSDFMPPHPGVHLLSQTEWAVLMYLTDGLTSKDIAIIMNVMPKSVDNYKNRIGKKLGISGYGELCLFAEEKHILLYDWVKVIYPEVFNRLLKKSAKMNQIRLEEMGIVNGGRFLLDANNHEFFDTITSVNFTSIFEVKFGLF